VHAPKSALTLGGFLVDQWLPAIESSVRPATFESYARLVRSHVVPNIGNIALQNVSPATLTAFYGDRLRRGRLSAGHVGEPLSPRTVRYCTRSCIAPSPTP
jgi:integrase